MIDETEKNKNYFLFLKKLNKIGINTDILNEKLSNKIENASFSMTNETETAFDGSLLHVVLRIFTPYAIKINELMPEEMRVEQNTIIKVCLLIFLSKSEMFVKNDNKWEVENRGKAYKYAPYPFALKMGMRSLVLCESCGIYFEPNEIEAMISLDKSQDDKQAEFYSSTLSTIIKQANELTNLQLRMTK